MPGYCFTYQSIPESEERFLDDIDRVVRECRIEKATADRLRLTLSEAFTNALVHGNRHDLRKSIRVSLQVNKSSICADIVDEGNGGLQRIRERKPPSLMAEGGRGIDLITHYASNAEFSENEKGHLTVTIRFDRPTPQEIER